ncbi:hypothetical protein RRG08_059521 [Elysia crispata]|uniref:Uncharacterized protein n=1 Tax=Elysia crispata TaxID=231223 RepID=A0AAE1D1Q2_9GAST|nr:hypothetical protein RRG08_059521 [Elysia crispata]
MTLPVHQRVCMFVQLSFAIVRLSRITPTSAERLIICPSCIAHGGSFVCTSDARVTCTLSRYVDGDGWVFVCVQGDSFIFFPNSGVVSYMSRTLELCLTEAVISRKTNSTQKYLIGWRSSGSSQRDAKKLRSHVINRPFDWCIATGSDSFGVGIRSPGSIPQWGEGVRPDKQ